MNESLLRRRLPRASCDPWSCCEILGLHLDLSILHHLACRVCTCTISDFNILRLLVTCLMRAVYGGKGTYARRRTYRGLMKLWLVLVT